MQKFNTLLTVILAIAVAYLLIDRSGEGSSPDDTQAPTQVTDSLHASASEGTIAPARVAYINIDTINNNFDFLTEQVKFLGEQRDAKRASAERERARLEQRTMELSQQNYTSQAQVDEAEQEIMQKERSFQNLTERMTQEIMNLEIKIEKELGERLQVQVDSINSVYRYDYILAKSQGGGVIVTNEMYDLTDEVLKALNSEYARDQAKSTEAPK